MTISTWATALMLAGITTMTFAVNREDYRSWVPYSFGLCAIVGAASVARALPSGQVTLGTLFKWSPPVAWRLMSQLSPVLFLSLAYPIAARNLSTFEVAGLPFPRLLLATSITAPWLSQIVCMPLFAALSPHAADSDPAQLRIRALETWPWSLLSAVPAVAALVGPVWLIERWRLSAVLVYAVLCLLNAAFAQSLVYSIVSRHSILWLLGWAAYASALLGAPRLCFLPPVAGMSVEVLYLVLQTRSSPLNLRRPPHILVNFAKGGLLGCVLWSDKYLYFLRFPHAFNAGVLFGAMVPAILAYNFYFAVLAPRTDGLVETVRQAMSAEPISRLRQECETLSGHIRGSASQVGRLCALLSLVAISSLALIAPSQRFAVGSEMLACWCFVMGALACYKLAYLGQGRLAYGYGALHLILASAAFAIGPSGPAVYLMLTAVELILAMLVLSVCLRGWDRPEFMLFWRHAMQW